MIENQTPKVCSLQCRNQCSPCRQNFSCIKLLWLFLPIVYCFDYLLTKAGEQAIMKNNLWHAFRNFLFHMILLRVLDTPGRHFLTTKYIKFGKDIQPKLVIHFCEKSQFVKPCHGECIFYEALSARERIFKGH